MKKHEIQKILKANFLPISVQLVGLLVIIINLWLTTKLAPMAQDLALVRQRVEALEDIESDRISRTDAYAIFNSAMDQIKSMDNKLDYIYKMHMQ